MVSESDERTVVATSEPDFTYDLSTILHAVRSTEGSMKLQEASFDVLEADVSRNIDNRLRSYRNRSRCCNSLVNSEVTIN